MNAFKLVIPTIISALVWSCGNSDDQPEDAKIDEGHDIQEELDQVLYEHCVDPWYPLVLDTVHGGYLSDLVYRWQLDGPQNKMIVSQARHIWSASKLKEFYKDDQYLQYARHGFEFLKDVMWDEQHGGFYDLVDREGMVIENENDEIIKHAYGNAFAIYGLAAYYAAGGEQEALDLARKTFMWLEQNSHDTEFGGYFQFLARKGTPYETGYGDVPPKDQNSSIHLLEAFTELYQVWPDTLVAERLEEMLVLIRDTMVTEKGYLDLFFQADWTPLSFRDSTAEARQTNFNLDHVSFGHDIETAYLLLEAMEILGKGHDSTTINRAKQMVDHTLHYGWDDSLGGVYDGGYYFNLSGPLEIVKDTKVWWAQAEALNTLHLMAGIYPDDPLNFQDKYLKQWRYIKKYLLDHEHHGWYWGGLDKEPDRKNFPKGQIWKVNYHTIRSVMNCMNRGRDTSHHSHQTN